MPDALRRLRLVLLVACLLASGSVAVAVTLAQVPVGATAEVRDTTGRVVATAEFREGRGEVLITLMFPSPPALTGTHGLRIHEVGRCDPPDFMTAGGGFNPFGRKHGRQNPDGPQVGDLPNVNFTTGLTSYNTAAIGATLAAGSASLLGPNKTALIIYANPDDQQTDPDGKAGARVACGVITAGTTPAAGANNPAVAQPAVPKPAVSPPQPAAAVAQSPVAALPPGAGQPVPTSPAASPVAAQPAVPKPSPSLLPTVVRSPSPLPLQPAAPPPVAAQAQPQPSGGTGLPPLVAFIIALLAVSTVAAGLLLRRARS